jgi:tetratricopeptide (TPR) repeat protein
MKSILTAWCFWLSLAAPVVAQAGGEAGGKPASATEAAASKSARPKTSEAGRAALAAAKEHANRARGLRGPERNHALEVAAAAYDKVAADFSGEPAVAAVAAFTAAELWRQQGSLALAEKDFLLAASIDASRFGQRGLLGAADMQRRQKRNDEAMATYVKAAALEPGSARAQDARLWQGRLLQGAERLDEAIAAFQTALESATPGTQTIEASNFLALAWIDKGDLDAAARAIDHAEQSVTELGEEDPVVQERLHKSLEAMSAKKALQRARDKKNQAGKDAVGLEAGREQSK